MSAVKGTVCANGLHDWPMPSGYLAAHDEAARRLRNGWRNIRCRGCNRYGWVPGNLREEDGRKPADLSNGEERSA